MSVMTRGLIWARVADGKTVAGYEAVKFNAKGELDIARAQSELAVMAAQVAALRKYRQKR